MTAAAAAAPVPVDAVVTDYYSRNDLFFCGVGFSDSDHRAIAEPTVCCYVRYREIFSDRRKTTHIRRVEEKKKKTIYGKTRIIYKQIVIICIHVITQ